MDDKSLKKLASQFLSGELTSDSLQNAILSERSVRLDNVTLDFDRKRRCGFPEVIYGEGKAPEDVCAIFAALSEREMDAFATRISKEQAEVVLASHPKALYNPIARTLRLPTEESAHSKDVDGSTGEQFVAILTAGTSDLPVAEEAKETLDWMGIPNKCIHDVGVAGPHRLAERFNDFGNAAAIIVIAGLEGALPSVVGGYVNCPVIAVPTSVGYGASFGGVAALLGMLNSCASNVVVVNIDAGFRAAYVAGMIAKQLRDKETSS